MTKKRPEDESELTRGLEPSDVYYSTSTSENSTPERMYSASFEDVASDYIDLSESGSPVSLPGNGKDVSELNQEENISRNDSALGEKSSFCDNDSSDTNDDFRYRPTRVSYMYASHYTINSENLRREPLATFGKWNEKSSATEAEKGGKMAGKLCCEKLSEMLCCKEKCCVPLLLLLAILIVIVSCCCAKDGGGITKIYADITGSNLVAMVKSEWGKMVGLLYANKAATTPPPTTKKKNGDSKKKNGDSKKKTKKKKKK